VGFRAFVAGLRKVLSFINFAAREINCKIVYYGAGLGGKTTNLQHIYKKTAEQQKGKMISLATETERTLFFDFLPLDLGSVRGFKTRIHLYTVPGQVFYDASRKLILRGVDGIVFVADSQQERMDANVEALDNLMDNLKEHNYDFQKIPYVLQLNKRDLPNILPVDTLTKELRRKNETVIEAIAFQGGGVFETLKDIARQVLVELKQGGSVAATFWIASPKNQPVLRMFFFRQHAQFFHYFFQALAAFPVGTGREGLRMLRLSEFLVQILQVGHFKAKRLYSCQDVRCVHISSIR
jgi:signal recognition particle receptor subunit beta